MKKKYIKSGIISVLTICSLTISGCQKNPDSSVVVHKDMDKLIEQAKETVDDSKSIEQMGNEYTTYQTTFSDENLGVDVNADAKVDIPKVEQMSVMRIKQKNITQDLTDKVREVLIGTDDTLYDGAVLTTKTKKNIELEITNLRQNINEVKDNSDYDENSRKTIMEEYQNEIDELQSTYEAAPLDIEWSGNESDGMLRTVKELYAQKKSEYYEWQNELNPDGEVLYEITDGSKGYKEELYVQNNESYGNAIRYSKSMDGYIGKSSVTTDGTSLSLKGYNVDIWDADSNDIPEAIKCGEEADKWSESTKETLTISNEDAMKKADELLEKIGITDFVCTEDVKASETVTTDKDSGIHIYRKEYIFRYMREIDGVAVNYNAVLKHTEGSTSGGYVKKDWPAETIEIRVNDNGIVGFDYFAPIEITETVVEKSNVKSFDEVKSSFEKMVILKCAPESYDVNVQDLAFRKKVSIDHVSLCYARISEKDAFDSGLLVPIWNFEGIAEMDYEKDRVAYGSVMAINAIDGSIIDQELGY